MNKSTKSISNGVDQQNNESSQKRLESVDDLQENDTEQKRQQTDEDGNNFKNERVQAHDQFHTNKSSQFTNNNYSYISGSDKQFLSSQQNIQYHEKHDHNAQAQPPLMKKSVIDAYNHLHDYVQDIHGQITEKMKKTEEDFLYVYKEQMYTIQKELKALKKKMDDELLRQKANDKMNILTEERDYFKAEALRLDRTCKEQERDIEELQFKQKVLTEDKNYYEGFVIETKKENKALKAELLQLYKFKEAEERQQQKEQASKLAGNFQPENTVASQMMQTGQEEITDGQQFVQTDLRPYTQQNSRKNEIFLSEAEFSQSNKNIRNSTLLNTNGSQHQLSEQNFFSSPRAQTQHQKSRIKFKEFSKTGSEFNSKQYQSQFSTQSPTTNMEDLMQEIQCQKANEEKYIETIKQLRVFLDKEKINVRKAKANLSQTYQERSDLEQVLLECINETKKDIQRRRAMQKADQIMLQNYNLKRSQTQLKGQLQIINDENIPFDQFNAKDKMMILKQFISSEKFLDQIYQITFGHSKIPKPEKEQLLPETEVDPSLKQKDKNPFQLTESWKQDAKQAYQVFQNFKGFKYSFKPQTASGCKTMNNKELKSSLFNFTEKTGKSIHLIKSVQIDQQQILKPQIANKHKLYKDVCKEFHQKAQENKILIGI